MGGLAVLQPQDCLTDRLRRGNLSYSHMKIRRNPYPNPNPNFSKSNRRKRSPPRLVEEKHANNGNNMNNKSRHTEVTVKSLVMDGNGNNNNNKSRHTEITAKSLVMGQVKILKRGEELKETTVAETDAAAKDESVEVRESSDDLAWCSADRLGPEPETMSKQVRISDFYAGSAVIMSPPPSSLPFPGFVAKAAAAAAAAASVLANKNKNGDVANDLRRILRLDY